MTRPADSAAPAQELDPDQDWVTRCQAESGPCREEAFRVLHDRHMTRVYRICLRITSHPSDALDATQDTFLLAFRGIRGFRSQARFSRWLYRIAASVAIDQCRRRRPPQTFSDLEQPEPELGPRADPLAAAERRELRARVRRTLRRLSPRLRKVLVLRHFQGLSNGEIERCLGIAAGSVKSRMNRAHGAPIWRSNFPSEWAGRLAQLAAHGPSAAPRSPRAQALT